MHNKDLSLSILSPKLAICQLRADRPIPPWATKDKNFFSISKTKDELSIVCPEENVPGGVKSEKGWRAARIDELLDFSLVGVLASIIDPLAKEGISVFVISTYNTDYILLKEGRLEKAISIWRKIGFEVNLP